jgi:hypothetical protein
VTGNIMPVIGKGRQAAAGGGRTLLVTREFTCSSLVISQNTSDGSIDLPVADIHVTNDRLVHITVTHIHHLPVTSSSDWPVTSSTYLGHSIVLYIN